TRHHSVVVSIEGRPTNFGCDIENRTTADDEAIVLHLKPRVRWMLLETANGHLTSAVSSALSSAASPARSYLPFGFRGNESRHSMRDGTMNAGSCERQICKSASVSRPDFSFGAATTTIAWPSVGCGTPTAAASETSPEAKMTS